MKRLLLFTLTALLLLPLLCSCVMTGEDETLTARIIRIYPDADAILLAPMGMSEGQPPLFLYWEWHEELTEGDCMVLTYRGGLVEEKSAFLNAPLYRPKKTVSVTTDIKRFDNLASVYLDALTDLVADRGGFGSPIPEEWFSAVMESYAKEPVIDTIVGCNFFTTHGRTPKTRSPWEVLLAWREIELIKSAAQRAGRPGIGIGCVENAVSEIGELSGSSYGGFPQEDWHHTCFVSELKTSYGLLIKVAHLVKTGCTIHSFYNSILGGYAGNAAGVAICSVAGIIMECVVNMATTFSICPTYPFYNCDTAPELIWAASVVQQAMSRNTHLLTTVMTSPVSGPCTESLLYECASMATAATVSGASRIDGVRSAVGVEVLHVTGLEVRFNGEIAHAAAGVSRKDANEMIKEFQKHYVPVLDKKPIGKSFLECYDPIKIEPTQEWLDIYHKVKEDVERIGLKMKF